MSVEVKLIVRKAFKYGKKHYKPGDEFIPEGSKFDAGIIKSNMVAIDTTPFLEPNRAEWRKRRKYNKLGAKADERLEKEVKKKKAAAKKTAAKATEETKTEVKDGSRETR